MARAAAGGPGAGAQGGRVWRGPRSPKDLSTVSWVPRSYTFLGVPREDPGKTPAVAARWLHQAFRGAEAGEEAVRLALCILWWRKHIVAL